MLYGDLPCSGIKPDIVGLSCMLTVVETLTSLRKSLFTRPFTLTYGAVFGIILRRRRFLVVAWRLFCAALLLAPFRSTS